MKKLFLAVIVFAVAACGGGSGGGVFPARSESLRAMVIPSSRWTRQSSPSPAHEPTSGTFPASPCLWLSCSLSWFMVTGVLGMLFILNGSMLSTTMMSKERTAGTIEQLLMSPATTTEIVVAKIIPLFTQFAAMGLLSLAAIRFVFHVPFHGSLAIVAAGAIFCMLSGIALGMFISTIAKSALQAQLSVFFLNPPLASLSGAFTPIEAMPKWLQPLTNLNPLAHFAIITRSALIENSGFDALWRDFAALFAFTAVLLTLSVLRYRRQLA